MRRSLNPSWFDTLPLYQTLFQLLDGPQEKEGITICATIHCPSIETFRLFEQVLLLQQGRVVCHGDNGPPIMTYFADNFPEVCGPSRDPTLSSTALFGP